MHSLREHFRCAGLGDAGGSVLHGFFGFGQAPATLSVRQQMARVRRPAVMHLNVIRLAFDTIPTNQRATFDRRIDLAVHRTREIYDQAGIGVVRVQHFLIEDAVAGLFPEIDNDGEADDLCGAFSVDNDGIDTFIVLTYAGNRVGSSRSPGPCDKDGKSSGIVVEVQQGNAELMATAYAHELCHFLGVSGHSDDQDNLMFSGQNGRKLNTGQIVRILGHCMLTQCPTPQEI